MGLFGLGDDAAASVDFLVCWCYVVAFSWVPVVGGFLVAWFGVVVVQAVVVGLRGVCGCWLGFVGLSLLVCGFEFCDFVVLI